MIPGKLRIGQFVSARIDFAETFLESKIQASPGICAILQ